MQNKKPPFEITEAALSDVMAIGELVGKISSTPQLSSGPILRRENRILSAEKCLYSKFRCPTAIGCFPRNRKPASCRIDERGETDANPKWTLLDL